MDYRVDLYLQNKYFGIMIKNYTLENYLMIQFMKLA